ncbi:MAG: CocE/NonD family hydrolase [Colwellia sp.]|nr:CocE/NonD family hydrolase [Colwellia sp.]
MNKEIQGFCLCIGMMGLAYVALLILLVLFTGAKIVKTIMIIASISAMLLSLGLSSQVKSRIKKKLFNQTC